MKRLLAYDGEFVVKAGQSQFRMLHTNRWIENDIFWQGLAGYEPQSVDVWIRAAQQAQTIIDIGANSGLFALLAKAVQPKSAVYGFEPLPNFRELFQQNSRLNNFDIHVDGHALSNFVGEATFYTPQEQQGNVYSSSLSKEHYFEHQHSQPEELKVPVTTFDEFAKQNNIGVVDLVKIDAEGHGFAVLEGMRQTVQNHTPDFLIEIQTEDEGRNTMQILPPETYRYFNIDEKSGLKSVPMLTTSDTLNYFVCKATTAQKLSL